MPIDVRMALWDYCPAANTLLDDFEFPEDVVIHMIRRPLDLWNEISPDICRATPDTFPYREHWLQCTCGFLLTASARLQRRNWLQYSAGGLQVQDKSLWANYQQEGAQLVAEFKDWAKQKKVELNLDRGYGTLGSTY